MASSHRLFSRPSLFLVVFLVVASAAPTSIAGEFDRSPLRLTERQSSGLRDAHALYHPHFSSKVLDTATLSQTAREDDLVPDGADAVDDNQTIVEDDAVDADKPDTRSEDLGETKDDATEEVEGKAGEESDHGDKAEEGDASDPQSEADVAGESESSEDSDKSTSTESDVGTSTEKGTDVQQTDSNDEEIEKEEEQRSTGGAELASENQTDPFDAFVLMQMVEVNSDEGFKRVTIYEHGAFVGPFAISPNTSNIEGLKESSDAEWYLDEDYIDRIAFQFNYLPDSKDYDISTPIVMTESVSGVQPSVEDFTNSQSTGAGSFTLLYRCQRDAPETSRISMKLQVTPDRAVETTWKKKCGRGRFEHMDFGFTTHDHSVSLFNADGTYGTDEQKTLEVGPLETSTELVLRLIAPAQNLQFSDPYVSSKSDDVSVELRGTIASGTLTSDTSTSFSILYKCETATTAEIDFTLEIPPWDNVTAHWRKDCGGSYSQALLIGTTGKESFDVMQDGELSSRYNVTEETTLDEASGRVEVIPAELDSKRFFVTNSDDTSEIHIQTITMTMSNPEVVSTVVTTPLLATSYIPLTGDVVQREETKSLTLHFVCKREGRSLVLVTLPTLRYKNVEFGFIKECDEPKVYHHSGFLQTASSLMAVALGLGVIGTIAICVYLRRRQGRKYAAVPTSDPLGP